MEEKIKIRNLKKEDRKEYLTLLSQLTKCNIYSQSKFDKLFKKIFSNKNVYIRVLSYSNKIVACGTIFIEDKFTRDTCKAGHIEEIVVLEKYKKRGLGRKIMKDLINIGRKNKVYKIILNCKNEVVPFYKKCGFSKIGREMEIRF